MRYILILAAMLICATPALAADPQTDAGIKELAGQVAQREHINPQTAESYVIALNHKLKAKAQAQADATGASTLLANFWDKEAKLLLLSGVVEAEGQALLERLGTGTPGTPIPAALEAQARQWMNKALQLGMLSADTTLAAVDYATRSAQTSPHCHPQFTGKCADVLKYGTDLIKLSGQQTDLASASAKLLVLKVAKRLSY